MWFKNILNEYKINNEEIEIKIKEKNNREIDICIINNNEMIDSYTFFRLARNGIYNKLLMNYPYKIKSLEHNMYEQTDLIPKNTYIISLGF